MRTKERPIIFSGPMVRAILEGRKTQTRRVAHIDKETRGADRIIYTDKGLLVPQKQGDQLFTGWVAEVDKLGGKTGLHLPLSIQCPYGQPGDRLWVRETWFPKASRGAVFKADFHAIEAAGIAGMYGGWKPSIHMPRWASRLTLEIVKVRAQRVQEISGPDCIAEGIENHVADSNKPEQVEASVRQVFRNLWDSINAKRGFGWDKNPWVWVVEFKVATT